MLTLELLKQMQEKKSESVNVKLTIEVSCRREILEALLREERPMLKIIIEED